ncbi:MAG: hypothetical protein CL462_10915 [Acidimicrobiaceae bacterium]|nr:hypothetical protein [Acidimicrobiaceae bacterium]
MGIEAKPLLSHVDMRELGATLAQRARVDISEEDVQVDGNEVRMILVGSCLRGVSGTNAITSA